MKFKTLAKLGVSAIMVVVLTVVVDFGELLKAIREIPAWVICVLIAGYLLGQALSAFKWWLIVRASGIDAPYLRTLRAYFVGMFTNCFGFGLVGGDVTRAIILTHGSSTKAAALGSVVADRAHGLATLAVIGLVSALLFGSAGLDLEFAYLLIGIGACIGLGWFIGPIVLKRWAHSDHIVSKSFRQIAAAFPRKPSLLLTITFLSIAFHTIQILLHWVIISGFGIESIPLSFLFVAIPFVNILSSLPISWNGLGVRENAYVFFFTPQFLTGEQAVAMGAIWLLAIASTSALGGIIAAASHDFHYLKKPSGTLSKSQTPA